LVIVIRGYEELFFDFPTDERRSSFVKLLETQAERVRNRPTSEGSQQNQTKPDVLFLEDVDSRTSLVDDSSDEDTAPGDEHGAASHMFQSTSSTFLTFKPSKPMHITCLTIGSRGDVQPYIALAKGLIADGHKVRIATHGEFKEWIESVRSTLLRFISFVDGIEIARNRVWLCRRRPCGADEDLRREWDVYGLVFEGRDYEGGVLWFWSLFPSVTKFVFPRSSVLGLMTCSKRHGMHVKERTC